MIPYGRQHIGDEEVAAVLEALKSNHITQGPRVPEFEVALAQKVNVRHALAVNSATSALHIACLALGLSEGGLLWTSPNSFVASPNVARLCGANVDFVDINPDTFNMCPLELERKLILAKSEGQLPDIVMPVHFGGESCNMKRIAALGKKYGFKIIEDASHAVGAKYAGIPVGSCRYSDATVYSFHPVKIITTAEGGMVFTNNDELATKMNLFRSHGVTRDKSLMTHASDGPWYYQQVELGLNYRLTELQAALGIEQLKRLDEFLAKRHKIAGVYDSAFSDSPFRAQERLKDNYSALHLYIIRLDDTYSKADRAVLFKYMRDAGIGVNVLYIPIHTQPYYAAQGFQSGDCPNSVDYYERCLALPMYPDLTTEQQLYVIETLQNGVLSLRT